MLGLKVVYNDEIYIIIHEYGNGRMEIEKENSKSCYHNVELVKKEQVRFLKVNQLH